MLVAHDEMCTVLLFGVYLNSPKIVTDITYHLIKNALYMSSCIIKFDIDAANGVLLALLTVYFRFRGFN